MPGRPMAYFDDDVRQAMMFEEIRQHGPSDQLVELLKPQRPLTETQKSRLADNLIPSLTADDAGRIEGALQVLAILRGSGTSQRAQRIDAAVLAAAPHLLTVGKTSKRELAAYLGEIKSDRSRALLWQLTGDHDARNQALHSLCLIGDRRDSRRLSEEMQRSQRAL